MGNVSIRRIKVRMMDVNKKYGFLDLRKLTNFQRTLGSHLIYLVD